MANLVSVIRARLVHFERAVVQLNLVSADLKYTPLYRLLSNYEHREGELLSVREIVNNSQNDKENINGSIRGRWSKAGCVLTIVRSPPPVGVILLARHAMRASDVSMAAPGRIIRRWRRFVEWDSALRNVRCEDGFELEIGEKKRLSLFYNSA